MTYDSYYLIFIGGAIAAGLMLVITIILFFVFNIPKVIGDLSGSTAKKAIENIRTKNETTGIKTFRSSPTNKARGKLTDRMTASGKLIPQNRNDNIGAMSTEKIRQNSAGPVVNTLGEATSILDENQQGNASFGTTILSENQPVNRETTVLTGELNNFITPQPQNVAVSWNTAGTFAIIRDITFIHTDEVIA